MILGTGMPSRTEAKGDSKKRSRTARKKKVVGARKKGTRKRAAATKPVSEKSKEAAAEGALESVTGSSGNAAAETERESGLQDTIEALRPTDGEEGEKKKISRKDLLEKAIERVKEKLDKDKDLSPGIIGNLVQLLKLDRDLVDDEEVVKEIRVLWEEMNGDSTGK